MKQLMLTVTMVFALAMGAMAADIPVYPNTSGVFDLGCQDAKAFRGEAFDKNIDSFNMSFEIQDSLIIVAVAEVDAVTGIARVPVDAVTLPTPGDVRVVCFAIDRSGNRSARSVDSFLVDRTAPEAPTLLAP